MSLQDAGKSQNGEGNPFSSKVKSFVLSGHGEAHVVYADGRAVVFSSETWKVHNRLRHRVDQLIPTPDGRYLISAKYNRVQIWHNMDGADLINEWTAHAEPITALQVSQDSKTIATASSDGKIKLWNLEKGELKGTMMGHEKCVNAIALSPTQELLASGSDDRTVRIWNLQTQREIMRSNSHGGPILTIQYSPDGKTLAYAGMDMAIRLCRASDGSEVRELRAHRRSVAALAFSPDGKILLSGGFDRDFALRAWRLESGTEIPHLTKQLSQISHLSYDPKGQIIAVTYTNGRIAVLNARTGEKVEVATKVIERTNRE
jgi:WD40 repeat protein